MSCASEYSAKTIKFKNIKKPLDELWDQDFQSEEEAFWIFTMMMESMIPIDYYSNLSGVLIDQNIFHNLMRERLPDLCQHFESIGLDLSFLAINWITCLLCMGLPQDVSDRIWDLFFLRGHKVIFSFLLAIMQSMKAELMRMQNFDEAMQFISESPRDLVNMKVLIQLAEQDRFKITNKQLSELR